MFHIIICVVISITAFSTTKKPMKNRKKTEPNLGNTNDNNIMSSLSGLGRVPPHE